MMMNSPTYLTIFEGKKTLIVCTRERALGANFLPGKWPLDEPSKASFVAQVASVYFGKLCSTFPCERHEMHIAHYLFLLLSLLLGGILGNFYPTKCTYQHFFFPSFHFLLVVCVLMQWALLQVFKNSKYHTFG